MKDNLSFIVEAEKKKLGKPKPKGAIFARPNFSISELKEKRKEDAQSLAQLALDIYKEERQR